MTRILECWPPGLGVWNLYGRWFPGFRFTPYLVQGVAFSAESFLRWRHPGQRSVSWLLSLSYLAKKKLREVDRRTKESYNRVYSKWQCSCHFIMKLSSSFNFLSDVYFCLQCILPLLGPRYFKFNGFIYVTLTLEFQWHSCDPIFRNNKRDSMDTAKKHGSSEKAGSKSCINAIIQQAGSR